MTGEGEGFVPSLLGSLWCMADHYWLKDMILDSGKEGRSSGLGMQRYPEGIDTMYSFDTSH